VVQPTHIPYAFSGASASLAVFKGRLFVAWKESTNLNKLLFASTTFASRTQWAQSVWSVPLQIPSAVSDAEPSLATFENIPLVGDLLFAAWKDPGELVGVRYAMFNGSNWSQPLLIPIVTNQAPALVFFQQQLYLFCSDAQDDVYYCRLAPLSDAWSPPVYVVGIQTNDKPAVAATPDLLTVATSHGQARLMRSSSFDGTNWQTEAFIPPVTRSQTNPALAAAWGTLWFLWKAGSDSDPWVTSPAPSDQALHFSSYDGSVWAPDVIAAGAWTTRHPALVFYDGVMFAAWIEPTPLQPICWAPLLALDAPQLAGNFLPGATLNSINRTWWDGVNNETNQFTQQILLAAVARNGQLGVFYETSDGPYHLGWVGDEILAPNAPLYSGGVSDGSGNCEYIAWSSTNSSLFGYDLNSTEYGAPWDIYSWPNPWPSLPMGAAFVRDDRSNFLAVDNSGTLQLFPNTGGSVPLSPPNFAPPGAPLAIAIRTGAVSYYFSQSGPQCVFVIGNDGLLWAASQGPEFASFGDPGWTAAEPIGGNFVPGSNIATGYQVSRQQHLTESNVMGYTQLDVFVIDSSGVLQILWESQGSGWQKVAMVDGGGLPPGAPLATAYQDWKYDSAWVSGPFGNQLDVFAVDANGRLQVWWVYQSTSWTHGSMPYDLLFTPGTFIATGYQHYDSSQLSHQTDVFLVDPNGQIRVFWEIDSGNWATGIMPGS
jgi:hypothetical protein